jgi:hypothetical protein
MLCAQFSRLANELYEMFLLIDKHELIHDCNKVCDACTYPNVCRTNSSCSPPPPQAELILLLLKFLSGSEANQAQLGLNSDCIEKLMSTLGGGRVVVMVLTVCCVDCFIKIAPNERM